MKSDPKRAERTRQKLINIGPNLVTAISRETGISRRWLHYFKAGKKPRPKIAMLEVLEVGLKVVAKQNQ